MQKKIPLFYFPSTICWVDDNQLFLDAANGVFKDNYHCLTFTNPQHAFHFLSSYTLPYANFTRAFTESDLFDTHNHLPVDIDISAITQLANMQEAQNEIAILVIDNNMPGITGLEICHKLKDAPYKKILLTGETNHAAIIDAFNQGIIDKFVAKDQNISINLQKNIAELSMQYFFNKTQNLISHLEASSATPLSDPIFIDFFHNWCIANDINAFYLINRHGSFLMKRRDGTVIYFIVMSESAKNEFVKLHDDALDKTGNLLSQVSSGKSIPFFGIGKESWEFDFDDWEKYFYPSNFIKGKEIYYWTVINGDNK